MTHIQYISLLQDNICVQTKRVIIHLYSDLLCCH